MYVCMYVYIFTYYICNMYAFDRLICVYIYIYICKINVLKQSKQCKACVIF